MDLLAIFGAKYLIFFIILIALICFWKLDANRKKEFLIFSFLALPVIFIVSRIAGHLYYDPRPFVAGHFTPLVPHADDNGFPSDHTLLASAFAMLVYFFNKKWGIALLALSILVGLARVYAGVHHLIDILGSLFISVIVILVIYQFLPKMKNLVSKK